MSKSTAAEVLEKHHRRIEALCMSLDWRESDPKALLEVLTNTWNAHIKVEREVYYPVAKRMQGDFVRAHRDERSIAKKALDPLRRTDPADDAFGPLVLALEVLIHDHVEAHEDVLFPPVDAALDRTLLGGIAREIEARYAGARSPPRD